MTDWAARVLDQVDAGAPAAVAHLTELVRVPSLGGSDAECEIQAMLATWLGAAGLEVDHWALPLDDLLAEAGFPGVEVDRAEAWGLVGRLPGHGDGPSLLLDAHVDVVPTGDLAAWTHPDPFSGHVAAGELHGRGACDMKAGLVAAMAAAAAVRRAGAPLRGDLLVACVPGEEDGGLGTYATLRRGWRADACVIPEPTGLDPVPANAGALTFRLRVPGLAAHASRRTEGVSALDKLVPLLTALSRLEQARSADVDPLMRRWPVAYPLSIGRVQAGDWASTVPDLLVADGRLGVALDEPVDDARRALEVTVAEACADDPWLAGHPATVEWWGGQFASGRLPAASDLAARVSSAHDRAGGGPQTSWAAPYGSDLRLLAAAGVPTMLYGPGDAALAHAANERVPVAELQAATRTLALLALDVCELARP